MQEMIMDAVLIAIYAIGVGTISSMVGIGGGIFKYHVKRIATQGIRNSKIGLYIWMHGNIHRKCIPANIVGCDPNQGDGINGINCPGVCKGAGRIL